MGIMGIWDAAQGIEPHKSVRKRLVLPSDDSAIISKQSGRSFDRPPKDLSALNHLSLKPFSGTLLVKMLSAISISRFACVEPRKAFTAVGSSLFRFVCINSRRLNSKVRHHSLLNANLGTPTLRQKLY